MSQPPQPLVLADAEGPVLTVTINRLEKRNATNAEVLCRLYDAWIRLDQGDSLRVAILTGWGNTFCAWMDLAEIGRLRAGVRDNELRGPAAPPGQLRGGGGDAANRRGHPGPASLRTGTDQPCDT